MTKAWDGKCPCNASEWPRIDFTAARVGLFTRDSKMANMDVLKRQG